MKYKSLVIAASFAAAIPVWAAAPVVTHGPYLFNPDCGKMSVGWVTEENSGGGVEYRKKGESEFKTVWDQAHGQIRGNRPYHVVHLDGLEEGAEYEYRLIVYDTSQKECRVASIEADNGKLTVPAEGGYSFTAFDRDCGDYKVFLTSDTHDQPMVIENLIRNNDALDASFYILLGDVASQMSSPEAMYHGFVDKTTEMYGKEKPTVFIRGNHEWRGGASNDWPEYLATPNDRTYYAFTQGNVFYIVLDSGEDKTDKTPKHGYTDLNLSDEFRAEERLWLENVVASPEFRNAKFRVVLSHIPTHGLPDDYTLQEMQKMTKGLFDGTDPENRIHLMIGGHEHLYLRVDAGSNATKVNDRPTYTTSPLVYGEGFTYTVVINDGPEWGGVDNSAIILEVKDDELLLTAGDTEGNVFDQFSISPEGRVKDLIEVAVFPKK